MLFNTIDLILSLTHFSFILFDISNLNLYTDLFQINNTNKILNTKYSKYKSFKV